MDVPQSTLNKIQSQFHSDKERKAAVIRVYLIEHPHPTWEHVSDVIYQLNDGQYHSVLERLQSLFPTGEHLMFVACYHRILLLQDSVLYSSSCAEYFIHRSASCQANL